jgi:hypothetical protein
MATKKRKKPLPFCVISTTGTQARCRNEKEPRDEQRVLTPGE